MDDVTFGRNGRHAKTWRLHCAATAMSGMTIPGRSLIAVNTCFTMCRCSTLTQQGYVETECSDNLLETVFCDT